MIGRIPDGIRYHYDDDDHFGFLRFDHMIEWLNWYNKKLYEHPAYEASESTSKSVVQKEEGQQKEQGISPCTTNPDAVPTDGTSRPNEIFDELVKLFSSHSSKLYEFYETLFGGKGTSLDDGGNTAMGILKENHVNILRELQLNNMVIVNDVLKRIAVYDKNGALLFKKGDFAPELSKNRTHQAMVGHYRTVTEMLRNKVFLNAYEEDDEMTGYQANLQTTKQATQMSLSASLLLTLGYLNIYHLFHNSAFESTHNDPEDQVNEAMDLYDLYDYNEKDKYLKTCYLTLKRVNNSKDGYIYELDGELKELTEIILDEENLKKHTLQNVFTNILVYLKKFSTNKKKYNLENIERLIYQIEKKTREFKEIDILVEDVQIINKTIQKRRREHLRYHTHSLDMLSKLFEDYHNNRLKLGNLVYDLLKTASHDYDPEYASNLLNSRCNNCFSESLDKIADVMKEELQFYTGIDIDQMNIEKNEIKFVSTRIRTVDLQIRRQKWLTLYHGGYGSLDRNVYEI